MNWGVIGCGDMAAKTTLPSLAAVSGCHVTAVCGRDAERTAAFARRFDVQRAYTDLAAFAADPEIDAVFVSTPVVHHAAHAIACLRAGKHVLCEKPMAMNTGQCLTMERAARDAGRLLSVAYYRRGYPQVQALRRLLRAGTIGRPRLYLFEYGTRYRPAAGAPGSWRLDPAQSGGGALPDIGSHRIDLARYLGGPFRAVGGLASFGVDAWGVEDAATVAIELGDGAQALVRVSFSADPHEDRVSVFGSEGTIVGESFESGAFTVVRGATTTRELVPPLPQSARQAPLIENFVAAVDGGAALLCPAREAVETSWAIDTVLRPEQASRALPSP
jgi:predicted dehydrogenase